MPASKTPWKKLNARSSVTSHIRSPVSPGWTSASSVLFKTPKSPSPVRRVTRRSSIYQKSVATSNTFKMPLSKVASPTGVKIRTRRSSLYQKGGARLLSPKELPARTRTRRTSMYVSKQSLPLVNEFSKVFNTPVRQPEPKMTKTPEKKMSPLKEVVAKTPKTRRTAIKSPSPKKVAQSATKTPKSVKKMSTPKEVVAKTPKTRRTAIKSPSPKKVAQSTTNTPKSVKKQTPEKKMSPLKEVVAKTPKTRRTAIKSPSPKKVAQSTTKTPKSVKKQTHKHKLSPRINNVIVAKSIVEIKSSTPESQNKSPKDKKRPLIKTPAPKKTPAQKNKTQAIKTPKAVIAIPAKKSSKESNVLTSTPSKIMTKSFYSTPGETPIQRTDDVVVFSAQLTQSTTRSTRKTAFTTPCSTPVQKKSTKKMPARKTPAVKRVRSDSASSPAAKRVKTSPKTKSLTSVKRPSKKVTPSKLPVAKVQLSPVEMTSVLKSVSRAERTEKRKATESDSPSPRPRKLARLADNVVRQSTPRIIKKVKRASPKKLAEIVNMNQSNNSDVKIADEFNDTVNTDSRSSRCIIL